MSQRLHVGHTDADFYELVLTTTDDALNLLLDRWIQHSGFTYCRPFKIRIADRNLWHQVEPDVRLALQTVGEPFPEAISGFYLGDLVIHHPTQDELDEFLSHEA